MFILLIIIAIIYISISLSLYNYIVSNYEPTNTFNVCLFLFPAYFSLSLLSFNDYLFQLNLSSRLGSLDPAWLPPHFRLCLMRSWILSRRSLSNRPLMVIRTYSFRQLILRTIKMLKLEIDFLANKNFPESQNSLFLMIVICI